MNGIPHLGELRIDFFAALSEGDVFTYSPSLNLGEVIEMGGKAGVDVAYCFAHSEAHRRHGDRTCHILGKNIKE